MMFPEVGPCVQRILDLLQNSAPSTVRAVASLVIRLAGQMFA